MYHTTTAALALALLALTHSTTSLPQKPHIIEERHIILESKRQADVSQLLQLASLAGITSLPNNPTLLLSLGPLANSLAAALPTPSVLSVLESAAPSDFVSQIINNPSYASSFEAQFSAGSSPSWFTALPTDVRSYLHTYEGFGVLAGAAGGVKSVESATAAEGSGSGSGTGTGTGGAASMTSGAGTTSTGAGGSSGTAGTGSAASGSGSGASATMGSSASVAGGGASSASSHAGSVAGPTGALAAGVVGVVGMLGAAALL